MTIWTTRPDRECTRHALPLKRCLPAKPISGIVLSPEIVGAYLHYWRGRTTPCAAPNCDACANNHAPRWYGYLEMWSPTTAARVLFEITPACVDAIADYVATHGTTRGAQLTLARATKKPNSRLTAEIKEGNYAADRLPTASDVAAHLTHIWETHHAPPGESSTVAGADVPATLPLGQRRHG